MTSISAHIVQLATRCALPSILPLTWLLPVFWLLRQEESDVPTYEIGVGDQFVCQLEPWNPKDADCIALRTSPTRMLGHLAREASAYLAPLLRDGFKASG